MRFRDLKTLYVVTSYPYLLPVTGEMLLMSNIVYPAMFEMYGDRLNIIFGSGISLVLIYLLCPYSTRGMYYTVRDTIRLDRVHGAARKKTLAIDDFVTTFCFSLVWVYFIFRFDSDMLRICCFLLTEGILLFTRRVVGHSTWNYSGKRW